MTDTLTFWYWSVDFEAFFGFESIAPSKLKASFSFSCRGFPPVFLGAGALFCFLALGGVIERIEPSWFDISSGFGCSSSESDFGRFFETVAFAFGFEVVCAIFFGGALASAAFFGAVFLVAFGLGLGFFPQIRNQEMEINVGFALTATCSGEKASESGPSSKTESTIGESIWRSCPGWNWRSLEEANFPVVK